MRCYSVQLEISPTGRTSGIVPNFKSNTGLLQFSQLWVTDEKFSLSSFLSWMIHGKDRPLTWTGRANYRMWTQNRKAARKLSSLWILWPELKQPGGEEGHTLLVRRKKWQVILCLGGQTRSELPFGHTVECEISAKQKSLFKLHVIDHCSVQETRSRHIVAYMKTVQSLGELESKKAE